MEIGIVGYGGVGSAIAYGLRICKHKIHEFDIDEHKLREASKL